GDYKRARRHSVSSMQMRFELRGGPRSHPPTPMPTVSFRLRLPATCCFATAVSALTMLAAAPREPAAIAAEHCAKCHNQNLVGSPAPNLVDSLSIYGGSDESILKSIRQGYPAAGMIGYEGLLTEEEIRGMLGY